MVTCGFGTYFLAVVLVRISKGHLSHVAGGKFIHLATATFHIEMQRPTQQEDRSLLAKEHVLQVGMSSCIYHNRV